ncbi:putative glutathione transferase [Medicago truncatula]|uniref:Glutathione S-transferase n=1 Tax=Medicago truncatula TaxID=3880 RepID=Q8H1Y6_MEDTR|nr:glutathione S-transferase U19 [Medicago truncatula]AAN08609.1 glutathione-S-transferse-like protein [Medicago truncatula]AES99128.1 glutathione S-transferase, amino-terminal domain protein [Medicago truncatula]AUW37472.1 putative tau class glutathione transferase GSTU11 [Medicago truncatula]RHN56837.1 putative glutathione transferase [Medicago truncatula]
MSKGDNVVVLDFWASPFCARVKIALEEKGVPHVDNEEDLFGKKSELLLKSNPIHQKVPVFLHNDKPVLESGIIVSYIDQVWSSNPLLPADAYDLAQARFLADFIDKKVFDTGRSIWASNGEEREVGTRDFIEVLKHLEEALGEKDYFGGDVFGYVDIIAIPHSAWFLAYEKLGNFKVEDHSPKISAWIKRSLQRESVKKVLPDPEKVYQFVLHFRKISGLE